MIMQWIHDRLRGWGAFILLAPLAFSFAVWGVQGIVSFNSQRESALTVNGREVDVERVKRVYQEQLAQVRRIYRDEAPAEIKKRLQDSIVEEFVSETLLDQRAEDERYVVSDAEVIRAVREVPAFQVSGQFNREAYEGLLRQNNYTPERFEAEERRNLRDQQIEQDLRVSALALPKEIAAAAALRGEQRTTAYAILPVAKFLPAVHPDEAALKAYFEAHAADYTSRDTVELSYLSLNLADVAKDVAVTDAGLKSFYDTVKERYVEPEKRRARHILIQSGSDEAAAKAKAELLYQEAVKPGADFASIAEKNSQDAGSASQGGDLGWAEKSFFVGPFADALFKMKPGEISAPVHTQFGWHVIKLEEVKAGASKSLEQVRPALEADYRKAEADKLFGERQERLDQLVFENGGSLEPAARGLKLVVHTIPDFTREQGGGELGANPRVVDAAFKADVLGGQNSRAIELQPGEVIALRVANHRPPAPRSFTDARAEVDKAARAQLAAAAAAKAGETLAAAVHAGQALKDAVHPLGATVGTDADKAAGDLIRLEPGRDLARREAKVSPELMRAVFAAAKPAEGHLSVGTVTLLGGDTAVYAVSAVKPGTVTAPKGGAPNDTARELAHAWANAEISSYVATLRKSAELHFNPQIFE
jgi:peptidyl-prolyl cis-trans isomerase D